MDLHRSFSSRVPLEVTDSAWMNSENSIRPSWQERGAGGLGQSGHLVRPDLGQVVGAAAGTGERGRQTPHGEGGRKGMRDRTRKGRKERGGVGLEMGQVGQEGREEGVRPQHRLHLWARAAWRSPPPGPRPTGSGLLKTGLQTVQSYLFVLQIRKLRPGALPRAKQCDCQRGVPGAEARASRNRKQPERPRAGARGQVTVDPP